ncbi:tetraspanin [Histoplasma capsulatum G186AR]|uniref:Tetraspanin n=2 Tax=Ajellomyces capsulatus TaxID=5037 RepID=C0NQ62_AJECG|nr:tetraspanin [Histoplasma capsulatum G186AR]EEH06334.1 tetraspanin [Histoplasma capsulatum G186AR]KAG5288198.1 tetraspanin [Histoplasma ohiense (nom. inval.)]KAG5293209.1 tetraspanin [Histoplasma capsulatum]QSS74659.1 tetraspanin [Histoplasma capsulatum G186AR]
MVNSILATFLVSEGLFVLGGALILAVALISKSQLGVEATLDNVAHILLLSHCPITPAIVNAGFIFFTFIISLPAIMLGTVRVWLKIHGWFVVASGIFTLCLGLSIWFETLKTRSKLEIMWNAQPAAIQSLLQQRFDCCGYLNSTSPPFQVDRICPNPLVAAQKAGCVGPFSNYANHFLDVIFTADFGVVAIDAILLLCIAIVLKDQKDRERYRQIDLKNGFETI